MVEPLARTMTEREFCDWQRYAARRMLPWRRIELQLAQLSQIVAASMGGVKNAKLSDYLFDPEDETGLATAEEEAAFFDFRPRKKG